MNRHALALAAVTLATVLVACGGASTSAARVAVDGTYLLSTVNGSPLPFTTESTTTTRVQVLSGQETATSHADGTIDLESIEVDRTSTLPGPAVTVDTVRRAENLPFDGTNFATGQYAGTIVGDTMTIYVGDRTYAYMRAR